MVKQDYKRLYMFRSSFPPFGKTRLQEIIYVSVFLPIDTRAYPAFLLPSQSRKTPHKNLKKKKNQNQNNKEKYELQIKNMWDIDETPFFSELHK